MLSDEDKKRVVKEWIGETFHDKHHNLPDMIPFFDVIIRQKDNEPSPMLPDKVLMCAGVRAGDLRDVRTKKHLWDDETQNASTLEVRQLIDRCFREVFASNANVQMVFKTKDSKKFAVTRGLVRHGADIVGFKDEVQEKDKKSKIYGYWLQGLGFANQWQPDSPQAKCIEWGAILGVTIHPKDFEDEHGIAPALFESYPTYSKKSILRILDNVPPDPMRSEDSDYIQGLRPPELESVGNDVEEKVLEASWLGNPMKPHVKCTFKHPSGTLAPDIWIPMSYMKIYYPDNVKHLL